jgi:hypothetical protein
VPPDPGAGFLTFDIITRIITGGLNGSPQHLVELRKLDRLDEEDQ